MNIIESERLRNNKRPTHLVWLDMEMTGLDPLIHRILEVAVIITDFEFNEIATYEAVISQPQEVVDNSNDFSMYAHTKSGLYDAVKNSKITETMAEDALVELIEQYVPEGAVFLAGNSIKSDRSFIDAHWKKLSSLLHYRMLDVTSFKIWWLGSGHGEYKKNEGHRALDDIYESIRELRYYLVEFKK